MFRYFFTVKAARPLSAERFSSREKHSRSRDCRVSQIRWPSSWQQPEVTGVWLVMRDSRVVLPAPLRPMRP